MIGSSILAAAVSAAFVALTVGVIVPPRRQLAARIEAYAAITRSRLGTGGGGDTFAVRRLVRPTRVSGTRAVYGPALANLANGLSRLVDAADNEQLERRLHQTGRDVDIDQYRMRQLASAVVGCTLGAALGATVSGVGTHSMLLFVCFAVAGLSLQRGALDRAIGARSALLRAEVPGIAQLLAVHLRTGHGPVESVRSIVRQSDGPVAEDCRIALGLIAGGMSPHVAYDRLAEETAEPAATRLYRLLATSVRTGGDIVEPLLAVANEVRAEQREALARRSVKRRTTMLIPLLLLVAPVMVLFVIAALPTLVFGQT